MRALLALSLVACSSPAPNPTPTPTPPAGSATTTSAATLTPGVELPEVTPAGFDAADKAEPTVSATLTGITVDGKLIASLKDGIAQPDELEGGALGMKIVKLGVIADQLDTSKRIVLAFDKRIPYRTMIATIYTLKQAKHRQFGLLARAGAHVVMASITLPDKQEAAADSGKNPGGGLEAQIEEVKNAKSPPKSPSKASPQPPQGPPPLQLIVSVTKTDVILWSISTQEGTLQKPKLAVKLSEKTALTDLNRALTEIVATRFATARAPDDRTIIIQADAATPMQLIAELIGTVRATPEAKELFPDVQFASSFE